MAGRELQLIVHLDHRVIDIRFARTAISACLEQWQRTEAHHRQSDAAQ